jgi:hypothetical protein
MYSENVKASIPLKDLGLGKVATLLSILGVLASAMLWLTNAVHVRPKLNETKALIREYSASREDLGKLTTQVNLSIRNIHREIQTYRKDTPTRAEIAKLSTTLSLELKNMDKRFDRLERLILQQQKK